MNGIRSNLACDHPLQFITSCNGPTERQADDIPSVQRGGLKSQRLPVKLSEEMYCNFSYASTPFGIGISDLSQFWKGTGK